MGRFRALSIDLLLLRLRSLEAVDVRPELYDLVEQVRGFAFPVRHCFCGVCVPRRELVGRMLAAAQTYFELIEREGGE